MDEFLTEAKEFYEINRKKFGNMLKKSNGVLFLDFEDLSAHSPELAELLIDKPDETVELLEVALTELTWTSDNVKVRFTSIPLTQNLKIGNLRSKNLGRMISIDGIIRKASEVRPIVTNIKFECPSCGTIISVLQIHKEQKEPSKCSCGRRGGFKKLSKDMIDAQVVILEESPDTLEDGSTQPKRMTVFLKEDLVDPTMEKRTIPGNKVKIIGVLKEVEMIGNGGRVLIRFDLAIDANNIIPLEEDINDVEISEEDEKTIKEISKKPDLINFLGKSIAPSVWGNEDVKRALTLQLFGGVRRKRTDGSFCAEQIHGLLVGDPGVAKSVILKYLTEISHKSRYVSGKSASGVGLTATVGRDEMTKSWVLEAGAMVLTNNGSLFIDEFEKMSEEDRSNLHEGMSVQTISVSKATIQATLNARTSILAAANPKFGRFDEDKPLASQINLMPSLLSRFDFIFIMRDVPEEIRDSMIADKIFGEHSEERTKMDILEKDMFKKYVAYAKRIKPKISKEAFEEIKSFYIGLRKKTKRIGGKSVIPIGARQLEGLIRFSEASAKIRLSKDVTKEDANLAITVMETYLKDVGYDKENDTFDIDKITGNSASQRSKIDTLKEIVKTLEQQHGKSVPIEDIKKEAISKFTDEEIDEILDKIVRNGDAFRPKRGIIQLM